jgi:type IV pilus assembly protein PilW
MRQIPSSKQRGVSLISLMIALAIATFLLAGLFQVWYQTRQTFSAQGQLAQLQDGERMALTMMGNTVQTGGYYPIYLNYQTPAPATPYSQFVSFPVRGDFTIAGQSLYGTGDGTTGTDTLEVRYVADANTLDCLGQSDPVGSSVVNTYAVANGNLQCTVAVTPSGGGAQPATTLPVVTGVTSLAVRYNVFTTGSPNTYQYMSAATVTASTLWPSVKSVLITLTFKNPLSGQPGQNATMPPITRVVALPQTAL